MAEGARGGQRFGEMEVWALEGYGAAYTLREMLTVKSDDIARSVGGIRCDYQRDDIGEQNLPESFNVMVYHLKGLALDVELLGGD